MPDTPRLTTALSDRYVFQRELGSGGMAIVYLAHDRKLDRDVALKLLRPELGAVLGAERFLTEIKISARLDHPHILTLIDSGDADGMLYYVLPYVRGETLRDKLNREHQLALDDAFTITKQVASALDYAHRQGLVHRDIKPENILLQEGEAMLTDFGIALAVKEAGGNRLTQTGLSLGTPQYMSPEQATGDRTVGQDARRSIRDRWRFRARSRGRPQTGRDHRGLPGRRRTAPLPPNVSNRGRRGCRPGDRRLGHAPPVESGRRQPGLAQQQNAAHRLGRHLLSRDFSGRQAARLRRAPLQRRRLHVLHRRARRGRQHDALDPRCRDLDLRS